MKQKPAKTLRLILGDQLDADHSWFEQIDPTVMYLIAELPSEVGYVRHHEQKICAFFLAMERFAQRLETAGHRVIHLTLDETHRFVDLPDCLNTISTAHQIEQIQYQRPDEYRLSEQLRLFADESSREVQMVDSEHFLLRYDEIAQYFSGSKPGKMEPFYRKMRQRFDILMDGDQPVGGRWNYDAENRKKLKANDIASIPPLKVLGNSIVDIRHRLKRHTVSCFGQCDDTIDWPVDSEQAQALLDYFCQVGLPVFGKFQDALTHQADDRWSLFHSRLSFALNAKLIRPQQVIDCAVGAYESAAQGDGDPIDLAQIEGFVRQILGWREYVRGVYWTQMPTYADSNALNAHRDLPDYFWTGKTKLACVSHAITQSLDNAYAHHIQRLMVTGNFCLLTGIDPDQVDAWYLGIYADAIEWVEMPNTRGMSQYADGGIVATKPYAAGGNYINKMSDYCAGCHYNQKERVGEMACPLNAWYWHFMNRHRDTLEKNPRIGMAYRSWDKMSQTDRDALLEQADYNLKRIAKL
jgi:deoxyribodipyrimidine photolyase-related protein